MSAQETLGFKTYAIVVNKQELANRERGERKRGRVAPQATTGSTRTRRRSDAAGCLVLRRH
jgi:hypothetical protein